MTNQCRDTGCPVSSYRWCIQPLHAVISRVLSAFFLRYVFTTDTFNSYDCVNAKGRRKENIWILNLSPPFIMTQQAYAAFFISQKIVYSFLHEPTVTLCFLMHSRWRSIFAAAFVGISSITFTLSCRRTSIAYYRFTSSDIENVMSKDVYYILSIVYF